MYDFWQQRYQEDGYAYGEQPNVLFKHFIDEREPGRLLLPAEGEGRNAVYAALKGWQVDAYDYSEQALENAEKFANAKGARVNFIHCSHDDVTECMAKDYDAIALIYVHVHNDIRRDFHKALLSLLKPGGEFMMEAFTTQQINNESGGPRVVEMLYTLQDVKDDFADSCDFELLEELNEELNEGKYHVGKADFIRMIAKKR